MRNTQKNTGNYGFISADIHQGYERFSVHSRGKQFAFMSLSALLTARNGSLNSWWRITFKNALLQGDKMFLNALHRMKNQICNTFATRCENADAVKATSLL